MGTLVLLDSRIFAGAVDLTGVSNKVGLSCEIEQKPTTPFGAGGWTTLLGGLFSTGIEASGQWEATADAASVDPASWGDLVSRGTHPWTVCPESADVGSLAWFTAALRSSYKLGGAVGEVAPWEAKAVSSAPLLRGVVVHAPGAARTASGVGTARNLGALLAPQRLYGALHVLSVAGTGTPTITARIESASTSAFTAATTRATFGAATTTGGRGQLATVAGPITDAWWRVAWTVTGTAPSFLFLASLGIA